MNRIQVDAAHRGVGGRVETAAATNGRRQAWISPVRYVLKIHFFIESGRKMIQFKIQFKTKSKIFIQKNIHSIESKIFNRIIHS